MLSGGKLRIPKKIKIRNCEFTVVVDREFTKRNPNRLGQTFMDSCVIKIDGSMSKQVQELVFLHEVIHAIEFHSGLNALFTPQQHEAIASEMAEAIYSLMKQGIFKEENAKLSRSTRLGSPRRRTGRVSKKTS